MYRTLPAAARRAVLPLLSAALVLAGADVRAAQLIGTSGPIDRRFDTEALWCGSTDQDPGPYRYTSVHFTPGSPSANVVIRAHNYYNGLWRNNRLDNLCIVTRATWDAYYEAVAHCPTCVVNGDHGFFRFDLVPAGELVYLELFDTDAAGWSLGDGATWNGSTSATRVLIDFPDPCNWDFTGGCLSVGGNDMQEWATSWRRIDGLVPGVEYVLSYWWRGATDGITDPDGDLQMEVWGPEPWADVTPAGIAPSVSSTAAAWADVDGDFDDDLYVARPASAFGGAPNSLYRNDGGGSFADVTPAGLDDADQAGGVAWGDYDNDGDPDLYLGNDSIGADRIFRNDGASGFFGLLPDPAPANTAGVTWADWENDGDLDPWASALFGPDDYLYRNEGGDTFLPFIANTAGTSSAAWGDYDGDRDADLYVVHLGAANWLLRNDGGGVLNFVSPGPWEDAGLGKAAAWFDYDNDLDLDLLLVNDLGPNRLFRNDGGDAFVEVPSGQLGSAGTSSNVAVGDFDHDGDLDVAMARNADANSHFRNDGGGSFVDVAGGPFPFTSDQSTLQLASSDWDRDGDLDLYLVNGGMQPDRLLRNDGASGTWLEVSLQGTLSNREGIGAHVLVHGTGSSSWLREVGPGTSYLAQHTRVAHFGLPGQQLVSVEVRWPSGIVQIFDDVPVNQAVLVIEQDPTPVLFPVPVAAFRLAGGRPNPFRDRTSIAWEMPRAGRAELTVYDVTGRRVRTLVSGAVEAGAQSTPWDARDGSGRRVASGVYFVRLEGAGRATTRKLIVTR
jgi:hypothetical protein